MSSQVLEAFTEARDMVVLGLTLNDHVIHEHANVFSGLTPKERVHHPLISGTNIDEAKWHGLKAYTTQSERHERGLRDVVFVHFDLMVS